MKPEIKRLRKAQKIMKDMIWPGYPFQMTVVLDMDDETGYIDYGKKKLSLDEIIKTVYTAAAYHGLGCSNAIKGSWLIDKHMDSPKDILEAKYDKFYIDSVEVVKFYFALNSAIVNYRKKDATIFACCDLDSGYVDCKVFTGDGKYEEIDTFVKDYFEYDPDAE